MNDTTTTPATTAHTPLPPVDPHVERVQMVVLGVVVAIIAIVTGGVALAALDKAATADRAYIAQGEGIEDALNSRYDEQIDIRRFRQSYGRSAPSRLEEHIYVDGVERLDCAITYTPGPDDTVRDAVMDCSVKPLTVTPDGPAGPVGSQRADN